METLIICQISNSYLTSAKAAKVLNTIVIK